MIVGSDMAFPCEGPNSPAYGLTKREYMATAILSGLCANSTSSGISSAPAFAVEMADFLLTALSTFKPGAES
jgi:hypothetical protein